MRIPEVRAELQALAIEHNIPRLSELAEELKRRPAYRKVGPKSEPMTEELKQEIRAFRTNHTDMSFQDISNHFGVNAGRVSEALRGKRT